MNKKRFFGNAIILALVTLVLRIICTAFRVVVSNKVGAECMGLYQLVCAVYGIAVTFATSGINFAATRIITQIVSKGKNNPKKALKNCVIYALFFGAAAFLCVFMLSDTIGNYLLCDKRTVLSLKLFSVSLPFISVSSAVSGYFFAFRKVTATLWIRAAEHFIEIATFFVLIGFVPKGNIELSCCVIVASAAFADIGGALFILIMACKDRPAANSAKFRGFFRQIIKVSLSAAFGGYIKSGLQTVENILIPAQLRRFGISKSVALVGYGTLCSMVMPVLFFPSFVLSAFSMLIIPEITEAQMLGRKEEIGKTIDFSIKITLYFSLFVSAVFIVFGEDIGKMLYNDYNASRLIKIMALIIPFMYIDSISDGMLKGLGEYNRVLLYSIADTVISIVLILLLVAKMGIYGYIVVIYVSTAVNTILGTGRLLKVSENSVSLVNDILLPLSVALLSVLSVSIVCRFITDEKNAVMLTFSLAVSLLLFLLLSKVCLKNVSLVLRKACRMFAEIGIKSNLQKRKSINNIRKHFLRGEIKNADDPTAYRKI